MPVRFFCTCLFLFLFLSAQMLQSPVVRGMTIGEEREIGEKLLYTVRSQFKLLDDPDISQYINGLGRDVLTVAGLQYFKYHFFVVASDEFNAFAAPSGLIFFFTGLIRTMDDENELVSVMAHEIGHVVSRHIARRLEKDAKVGAAATALAIASMALGIPGLSQGLMTGSLAAGQALSLHFSRQDEEEADRLAFTWMDKLRRDPQAMEQMLRTMRRITRYRSGQVPAYLLTHPDPEARLGYVQSLIETDENQQRHQYYRKIDNFDFLRFKYRILVQTEDPRQLRIMLQSVLTGPGSEQEKVMARYGLALLEARELNIQKGLDELEQVRRRYPDRAILKVDLGAMYLEDGQVDRALELLHQAVKHDPSNLYAAFVLARALAGKGEKNEARKLYLAVAREMPEYPKVYFELGRIESQAGREAESRFYLAKYYLYAGRMKLARQYLKIAARDKDLPLPMRREAKDILERLKKLKDL